MKEGLIDANLIVRFLTKDKPKAAERIKKLLASKNKTFFLTDTTMAEIVWVLSSFYNFDRKEITEKLRGILSLPTIKANKKILLKALELYRDKNIDFIDAYLAAIAIKENKVVYSLDKDFNKIAKVKRKEV